MTILTWLSQNILRQLLLILMTFLCTPTICKELMMTPHASIVELRQYTLRHGRRDELIKLFEHELIAPQEEAGMQVLGQFTDMHNEDRFVWLRGYADMEARKKGLQDFYFGSVWQQYRTQANDTMLDSDNVLLLRETRLGNGFILPTEKKTPQESKVKQERVFICTILYLKSDPDEEFLTFFERNVMPQLAKANITVIASYIPERSENNFPHLPVREKENVFVWFSSAVNMNAYAIMVKHLNEIKNGENDTALNSFLAKPSEILILSPTPRSKIN